MSSVSGSGGDSVIRRNVASQLIAFPELSLKADGSVVTSGATIRVKKDSSATADGGGTLAHDESGIWNYTPTQGETDCAILKLYLKATGAQTIVLNVVTTGADTSAVALGANTTTPPTAAAVADQVWDEARSGHATAGTFGEKVNAELDPAARVKLDGNQPDCNVLRTGVEYQHTQNSSAASTVNVTIEEA